MIWREEEIYGIIKKVCCIQYTYGDQNFNTERTFRGDPNYKRLFHALWLNGDENHE